MKEIGKLLLGAISWFIPKSAKKYFARKFSTIPRRIFVLLLWISFIMLGDRWKEAWIHLKPYITDSDTVAAAQPVPGQAAKSQPAPPVGPLATPPDVPSSKQRLRTMFLSFAGWLAMAFLIGLSVSSIAEERISEAVSDNIQQSKDTDGTSDESLQAQAKRLMELLLESGITEVHQSSGNAAIVQQPYANDMIEAAQQSKTLRLLSIAGFEYMGKGSDSLLYNVIAENKFSQVEVIILDAAHASSVARDRVKELKERDSTYDLERLTQDVDSTKRTAQKLYAKHAKIDLYLAREHPVFRLLLLDQCAFFSIYSPSRHGHESPVYKIEKSPNGGRTWYDSLGQHFANVKSRSEKFKFNA